MPPKKGLKDSDLKTFDEALLHMRKGRRVNRLQWDIDGYQGLRLTYTGVTQNGEFTRIDGRGSVHRYPISTEDVLADDWILR